VIWAGTGEGFGSRGKIRRGGGCQGKKGDGGGGVVSMVFGGRVAQWRGSGWEVEGDFREGEKGGWYGRVSECIEGPV